MTISWFPGHMHKARKDLRKLAKSVHLYVEVLDARAPLASANTDLREMFHGIPAIRLLSKADLADGEITLAWQRYFRQQDNTDSLTSSKDSPVSRHELLASANKLLARPKQQSPRRKQLVVAGIPNVGKSTLINILSGRKLSNTGNEPALTRAQQRIRLDDAWVLYDTPGLMLPRLDDQKAAQKLAVIGTIRNTAIDPEEVAWFAAEFLLAKYRPALREHYQLPESAAAPEDVLAAVASARGALGRGGQADWTRAAQLLLNDFRSGKLGRLSLESPPG